MTMTNNNKLARYIKDSSGSKTEMTTRSVNIEKRHQDFLKTNDLNLSKIVRDAIERLIGESSEDGETNE
jgi:hypothetical protein